MDNNYQQMKNDNYPANNYPPPQSAEYYQQPLQTNIYNQQYPQVANQQQIYQAQQPQAVYIQQPNFIPQVLPSQLDAYTTPILFKCPFCNQVNTSQVQTQAGSGTYLCCCLLCCFTAIILGLVPFCMDDCQDKIHICSVCGQRVGFNEYKPCG